MPNATGLIGGTFGEPIYGFVNDGAGGGLTNAPADTFLVNSSLSYLTPEEYEQKWNEQQKKKHDIKE
ncbi:hypothetical protein [Leptolyngbya sp. KIOST-1]|uniref:hypothetical protein n=1 Tax=Leptolyngbya sp. KIOST-1 TaxID=1229172 RepID=UPI00056797EC|nr:hypothetical protein [Leptolyngbya sp. KIOST-1]